MISLRMALCKESLESLTLKILGIETSCDDMSPLPREYTDMSAERSDI